MTMTTVAILVLTAAPPSLLVATEDLGGLDEALVVDGRAAEAYAEGHIAGAVHLDAAALSELRDGVKGLLKPLDEVREIVGAAGIDPGRHIIVYSDMADSVGRTLATRLFWVLDLLGYPRVSVLDGGIEKWQAEGRELATRAPRPQPVDTSRLTAKPRKLAVWQEAKAVVDGGPGVIIDARSREYFTGERRKDYVARAGHIPGACSLGADEYLVPETAQFRPVEELRALLRTRGIDEDTPTITYCNSGRSASVAYFAARLAGVKEVRLYDGAMAEWGRREDLAVETGAGSQ